MPHQFIVQRLNLDGSPCRQVSPWTGRIDSSWTSVVEADNLTAAALAVVKQWALYTTWPTILAVRYRDAPDSLTYFSVDRVVTTDYPVRKIDRPRPED